MYMLVCLRNECIGDNFHWEHHFSKTANLSLRTLLCDLLVIIHLPHHGILQYKYYIIFWMHLNTSNSWPLPWTSTHNTTTTIMIMIIITIIIIILNPKPYSLNHSKAHITCIYTWYWYPWFGHTVIGSHWWICFWWPSTCSDCQNAPIRDAFHENKSS